MNIAVMEETGGSSEQADSSKLQTKRSELTETPEQRRSEPKPAEHVQCPQQMECSVEQECSIEQTGSSTQQTAPSESTKDAGPELEAWSEPWLERLADQLASMPQLWRAGHSVRCRPKSARGFAYLRLLRAMSPHAEGSVQERVTRALHMCKSFFKLLRLKMREAAAAAACVEAARRACPAWVQRADGYLALMPAVFAQAQLVTNRLKKKKSGGPLAKPSPRPLEPPPVPCEPPEPLLESAAGARLLRRVVRGMRRAARACGGPTRAAAAAVARRLEDTEERVFALWCGMRKLAMFKLRALLARGDAPTAAGRLLAADWAVVDLLVLHGISLVGESSYQNYDQLSALLGTFHLVQRFDLEKPGEVVPPSQWVEAARWYSRNRVQMSALGLQKRWLELKLDTRRRFLSRMRRGPAAPAPLPLHQAIARRYEHVVVAKKCHPVSWRKLVAEGGAAPLTSERGPAPGEAAAPRARDPDDSSDCDADADAAATEGDDDDLTIVEKTLETIDLSEEADANAVNKLPPSNTVPESIITDNDVPKVDKTIDLCNEIVDLDAPSPKTDVLEALQELDVSNIETTILFESDEDDVECIDESESGDANNTVPSSVKEVNTNESHSVKGRHRRESSDSEDGNLVIDCDDNSIDSEDVRNTDMYNIIWKEIEREMLPEPFNRLPPVKGYRKSKKYPLLSEMLQTESLLKKSARDMKVYYNTKRLVATASQPYQNKVVSVTGRSQKHTSKGVNMDKLIHEAWLAEFGGSTGRGGGNSVVEVGSEGSDESSRSSGESGEGEDGDGVIDPKLLMDAVVLLRRIDEELPQLLSRHCTPSPTRLSSRESPPSSPPRSPTPPVSPPNTTPSAHASSLCQYYAGALCPRFVFLKRNIPLLKQCKPCSVVLSRVDAEGRRAGSRVAKKVELPDIEEVRRNNRSMLTAQVAPLTARLEDYDSSPEPPSCSSDSEWTPDDTERPGSAERSHSSERTQSAVSSADSEDSSNSTVPLPRPRPSTPTSEELSHLLKDLLAQGGSSGECNHGKSTGSRGPLSSVYAETCPSCAARVLSTPPLSGGQARLQRRLLRRLARHQPSTTATTATSTVSTAVSPAVSTAVSTPVTTTVTTVSWLAAAAKRPDRTTNSKKSRSKAAPKRARSPSPPPCPGPPDPEAAAREWLRQKNIAAERFGVQPRRYKRPAPPPAPAPDAPAHLMPLGPGAHQAPQDQPPPTQKPDGFHIVIENGVPFVQPVPDDTPPAVLRVTSGAAFLNKTHASNTPILLNHMNSSPPLLNMTNPPINNPQNILLNPNGSTASISSAPNPPLFNPNAVADINKKLNKLAPTTEAELGCFPVITNVHSLAKSNAHQMDPDNASTVYVVRKDPKTQRNYVVMPTPNRPGTGTSILLRPSQESNARSGESVVPPTAMPQVLNVSGNVHLPSTSVDQGLHLVVSQSRTHPVLTNMLNQPSIVVNGNLMQSVQRQQVSVRSDLPSNFVVTSTARAQPLLSCLDVTSQPSVFAGPGMPLVLRSVQAGPEDYWQQKLAQQNLVQQNVRTQQNVKKQKVSQKRVAKQKVSLQDVAKKVSTLDVAQKVTVMDVPQKVTPMEVAQKVTPLDVAEKVTPLEVLQKVTPMEVAQKVTPLDVAQKVMPLDVPQKVTPLDVAEKVTPLEVPQKVTPMEVAQKVTPMEVAQKVTPMEVAQKVTPLDVPQKVTPMDEAQKVTERNPETSAEESSGTEKAGEANEDSGGGSPWRAEPPSMLPMPAWLAWQARPTPASEWSAGRDPRSLAVLCTGPRLAEGWRLAGFLLVSDAMPPPAEAHYWALRPRTRLLLPDEDSCQSAKRVKLAGPRGWLKVRDFAREPAAEPRGRLEPAAEPRALRAPARVLVDGLVYQKLCDDPLVYAKLLVTVPDARACRGLLARGAALQLYCLRSGKLFPLQAEPKDDVSRITLSGDEEVSPALVSLAKQLYRLPESDPESPEEEEDRRTVVAAGRDAAPAPGRGGPAAGGGGGGGGGGPAAGAEPGAAERPSVHTRPIDPPSAPQDPVVIELSDED